VALFKDTHCRLGFSPETAVYHIVQVAQLRQAGLQVADRRADAAVAEGNQRLGTAVKQRPGKNAEDQPVMGIEVEYQLSLVVAGVYNKAHAALKMQAVFIPCCLHGCIYGIAGGNVTVCRTETVLALHVLAAGKKPDTPHGGKKTGIFPGGFSFRGIGAKIEHIARPVLQRTKYNAVVEIHKIEGSQCIASFIVCRKCLDEAFALRSVILSGSASLSGGPAGQKCSAQPGNGKKQG